VTAAETLRPKVLIIGGGPAGLSAARELAPRVDGEVFVVDREQTAGGIPRHSAHLGYGIRDLRRVMNGPAYAKRLVDHAVAAGATVRTGAMVTDWAGDTSVHLTTPQGRIRVDATAVLLATGARERPRAARMIPGDRPAGVYTTGQLQNLVHLHHRAVGSRAVVVGAELVSWSAVLTLRHAGCVTALMVTRHASPESYAAFNLCGRALLRTRVATRSAVTRIIGHGQLQAIEIEDLDTGSRRTVECDTLVLTGDWIPDHELARAAGIDLDPGTRGPLVDTALRTSRPGVFAAGNLVHAVDTADVAALDGRHAASQIVSWLAGDRPPDDGIAIRTEEPFRWVSPNRLRAADPAPARRRLLLWSDQLVRAPHVTITQNRRTLASRRIPWPASPGRVFRLPWSMLSTNDPQGGPITIRVR
jgi:thioredoxin reductase